jgi:hypothetical protein
MNPSFVLPLVLSFMAPGVKDKPAKPTIVGVWEVVSSNQPGIAIGSTIEYSKDGNYKLIVRLRAGAPGTEFEGGYKIDGLDSE